MRRALLGTIAVTGLVFGSAAMAQSAPPVPNASGSQVTNPNSKGATANEYLGKQDTGGMKVPNAPLAQGSVAPTPNASGSQVTNPNAVGSTANEYLHKQDTTGSIVTPNAPMAAPGNSAPPVPNASGSQTTNPNSFGNTAPVEVQKQN